jgi:RHS repeat-associated protein
MTTSSKTYSLLRLLGVLGLMLVLCGRLSAGTVEHNIYVNRVDLSIGSTYTLHDPTWADEDANPANFAASRENHVRLVYSRDAQSDVEGNDWKYVVKYTISFVGQNLAPVQDELVIEHGSGVHNYAGVKVYLPGAHTIMVHIDDIDVFGTTTVPDDIRLELATVTERYEQLDINNLPVATWDATLQTLHWGFVPGAESYDVEWYWEDDAWTVTTPYTDFEHRAIRVNVSDHHYRPDLSYREGTMHFRVRAVGRFIDNVTEYTHRRHGNWSAEETWTITTPDAFEKGMNLTYQTTFAEDGKFKKVMTYVDGAGKVRQSLTHLNSDGTTVVTQTEYDHEGRGVLTTIPIPLPAIDLEYKDLLNQNTSAAAYTKLDFDMNHSQTPSPMGLGSGAANYFSPGNTAFANTIHYGYIADADSFPFSQVEYMRDATGRVSRQGGVGPDHQLGSGHEVKFFYGNADATELHRMFGGNVGVASHYLKKMSIDPNGQVSFAWQDQEERVIATALAGDAPANLVELDDMPTETLTVDLQSRTVTGNNEVINTLDHTFLNEQLGKDYMFHWDLTGAIDKITCDICYGCTYEMEVTVMGPDGKLVELTGVNTGSFGTWTVNDTVLHGVIAPTGNLCPPYSHGASLEFELHADLLGGYRVYKTLKTVQPDYATMYALIEAEGDTTCGFQSLGDLIHIMEGAIDFSDCEEEPCTTTVMILDGPKGSPIDSVMIPCNPIFTMTPADIIETECEAIHRQMVADIAPGGWMHDSLTWTTLVGDTAAIDTFLFYNHREWCHYKFCKQDAPSRLWDLQMAAAPDYTFAEALHLIPPTNANTDLWDPWFNSNYGPFNPARPTQTMLDILWDAYPPQSLSIGLLEYYDEPTAPLVIYNLYAAQCATAACKDSLRWQLTVAAYLAEKNTLQLAYRVDSLECPYYHDAQAIVQEPALPAIATTNHAAYNSALMASNCNTSCAGSVEVWVSQLEAACTTLTQPQVVDLGNELLDFCLGNCQDGNPQALLTDTYVIAGDLDVVDSILTAASCPTALATITITDPYAYDDGQGTTYEGGCVIWDPGMIAIIDEVNANWPHPTNNLLPTANNAVLQWAYPTASDLKFDGDFLLLQTSSPCVAIALGNNGGDTVSISDIKELRDPELNPTGPLAQLPGFTYQGIEMKAIVPIAYYPFESVLSVYLHTDNTCTGGFPATPDTCAYPQMTADTLAGGPWMATVYPEDPAEACSTALLAQATYNAGLLYEAQMANLVAQAMAEATALCRQKPPMDENFTMTHVPKVYQYTLYYYDQAGSLIQTVPPEGVELLDEATALMWDNGTATRALHMPPHRMQTTYAFNSLGQMRKSHTPDGGDKQILYTSKDQVRLTQDARQNPNDDWAYVKYDELGRTVESGLCEGCTGITPQALDDNSFPDRSSQVLSDITTTHYDEAYDPTFAADNLRTRVAAATREDAEGDYVTTQVYDYDDHGNVRKTRTYLVGFGNFELEYQYDLISGKVNRANYQKGKPDYFAHRYAYDADNRLIKAETTRDNVFWDRDGRYFYYPHGPLARLEVGQDNVQGQDHYYSIHGWIKGVNMPGAQDGTIDPGLDGEVGSSGNNDKWVGRDAMAYSLGFYKDDYNPIGGSGMALGLMPDAWTEAEADGLVLSLANDAAGLYNGNIPIMVTDLKKASIGNSFIGGAIANAYQYDQLNRLKQGKTYHRASNAWTRFGSATPGVTYGLWDNAYTYDRNGNIETLSRSVPDFSAGFSFRTLDNLTYNYTLSSGEKVDNRLNSVVDLEPIPTTGDPGLVGSSYTYDEIGNLIADQTEDIANIDWDLHNKVRKVERASGSNDPELEFWYDGTGNRIHKRVTLASGAVKDEWYVRDPQGNEMAVYERVVDDGWLVTRCKEHAIYGSDRLGLDLNGVELSRYPVEAGGGDEEPTGDPSGRYALVIAEVMYDAPGTADDAKAGTEEHGGEYVVLINKSGMDLDLGDYTLRMGEDSLALSDTLPAGERVIVGFGENVASFMQMTAMPVAFEATVVVQSSFKLLDRGGIVSVTHGSGNEIDALAYGEFYGLDAGNPYIADTLLDSLGQRSSLKSVQRESYGGLTLGEGSIGEIDPGLDVEATEEAMVGSYALHRGRKVYELKNHLGNVLAVVSDVKIGKSSSSQVEWYEADVVEMTDYEPFGMMLANRHYVASDGYRFGFQGQEGDDEWNGEGNMLAFKYRIHDVRLGRFLSVDPLARSYPSNSTYAFSENDVIRAMELEGAEKTPRYSDPYGPYDPFGGGFTDMDHPIDFSGWESVQSSKIIKVQYGQIEVNCKKQWVNIVSETVNDVRIGGPAVGTSTARRSYILSTVETYIDKSGEIVGTSSGYMNVQIDKNGKIASYSSDICAGPGNSMTQEYKNAVAHTQNFCRASSFPSPIYLTWIEGMRLDDLENTLLGEMQENGVDLGLESISVVASKIFRKEMNISTLGTTGSLFGLYEYFNWDFDEKLKEVEDDILSNTYNIDSQVWRLEHCGSNNSPVLFKNGDREVPGQYNMTMPTWVPDSKCEE